MKISCNEILEPTRGNYLSIYGFKFKSYQYFENIVDFHKSNHCIIVYYQVTKRVIMTTY